MFKFNFTIGVVCCAQVLLTSTLYGWFGVFSKTLSFFNILLLYYYINLMSLIKCCLFCCLSLGNSLSCSIIFVSFLAFLKLYYMMNFLRLCNFISNFVSSCFSWFSNCSFLGSFKCISSRFLNMIKGSLFTIYVLTSIF